MRIIYVAKHQSGDNDDEGAICYALEQLGHEVIRYYERDGARAIEDHGDFLLFHKWHEPLTLEKAKMPKVFWYFDLVDFPSDPTLAHRGHQRVGWMRSTIPRVDLGFCTDGDWVARDRSGKLVRLTQGADERVAGIARKRGVTRPIVFTGLVKGGQARVSCIEALRDRYSSRFDIIEGRNRVHGRALSAILSNTAITIAPDGPVTDRYWSNRLYLSLSLGAFLLHPYCETLVDQYEIGTELVCYKSREEMFQLIDHYLVHDREREEIRLAGYDRTMAEHTYRHRCEKLVEIVKERLL